MIQLHAFPMSPNARRAQIALEEVGAPYEYVNVDLMQAAQKSADYLQLNPNGRVPTLVDGSYVLWESHAILQYVAAKFPHPELTGHTPEEIGDINKWMFLNAAHFGPAFAGVFAHTFRLPEDKRIPQIAEAGRAEGGRILKLLDETLRASDYLAANRFTLADISIAPSVFFAPMLGFDLEPMEGLRKWTDRLKARPSFKKVLG